VSAADPAPEHGVHGAAAARFSAGQIKKRLLYIIIPFFDILCSSFLAGRAAVPPFQKGGNPWGRLERDFDTTQQKKEKIKENCCAFFTNAL